MGGWQQANAASLGASLFTPVLNAGGHVPVDTEHDTAPWQRKTKIVCTIGPAVAARDKLFALADAGMNIARCVAVRVGSGTRAAGRRARRKWRRARHGAQCARLRVSAHARDTARYWRL